MGSANAKAAPTTYALGYALNDGTVISQFTTFDSCAVSSSDVLVKFTYAGDADLNGRVDGDEYFYIDDNYPTLSGSTWVMGDFNYDGQTGDADYALTSGTYLDGTSGNAMPRHSK